MTDTLRLAFDAVFLDLARHGLVPNDDRLREEMWREFQRDMAAGFPSLFKRAA